MLIMKTILVGITFTLFGTRYKKAIDTTYKSDIPQVFNDVG